MSSTTAAATAKTGHVIGATYRSSYWCENYTVERANGSGVTVWWHRQRRRTTHCTRLDTRDTRLA